MDKDKKVINLADRNNKNTKPKPILDKPRDLSPEEFIELLLEMLRNDDELQELIKKDEEKKNKSKGPHIVD